MRRKVSLSITIIMIATLVFNVINVSALTYGGTCGENLSWEFDNTNNTLTISGSGDMDDYYYYTTRAPWYSYMSRIKEIIIGNNVTSIGNYAFNLCTALTEITIPDNIKSIGKYAFEECGNLTSVTMGSGIESIGYAAFSECRNLTSVNISDLEAWCKIDFSSASNPLHWAKYLYLNGKLVTDVTIPNGITTIDNEAFYNCIALTNVTIPNSVTSIGDGAFQGCTGLTSVTIPGSVTTIGISVFRECTGLTNVTLSNGIESIGRYAFNDCEQLTSITFPDSIRHIGNSPLDRTAYYDEADNWENEVLYIGKHLVGAKSTITGDYTIKDNTLTIADGAFSFCSKLTGITIPNGVKSIGDSMFRNCTGLKSITIPDNVTTIGNSAFYKCTALTSITISNRVTSIGEEAFYNCTALTSITIPDSVEFIGKYAFEECGNLTSVTIPDSVKSIGGGAFMYCSGITSVNISDMEAWCKIKFGNASSNPLYNSDKPKQLYLNGNLITNLVIPNSVTTIGDYAFYNYTALTSVTIHDRVKAIGNSAFSNCTNLTSVNISDLEAWCKIDFSNDGSNPLYCAKQLYLNGKLVTNLVIPDGVTTIDNSAFCNCTALTSVTIPDSVTFIGDHAFYICTGLTSVTIPKSVTTIGEWAFASCKGLTKVTIPNSVEYIGDYAFYLCNNLTIYGGVGTCAESYARQQSITYVGTGTKTVCTTAADGKVTFAVTPSNLPNGAQIILACFKDGKMIETKYSTNKNQTINFATNKKFDTAMVYVWKSFGTMEPIWEAEIVQQ